MKLDLTIITARPSQVAARFWNFKIAQGPLVAHLVPPLIILVAGRTLEVLLAGQLPSQERNDFLSVPLRVNDERFPLVAHHLAFLEDVEVGDEVVAPVVVRRDRIKPGA